MHEEVLARVTRWIVNVAKKHAGGRVVSTLEGGYNLDALASSVVAHLKELVR